MKNIILLLLAIVVIWKLFTHSPEVTFGPGIKAEELPKQVDINRPVEFQFGEYQITEVAKFAIRAKVLSRKDYHLGREADLSPIDLALGWGRMSDENVLNQIQISQSGRFYRWRVESFPIPRKEIETSSANMHLIPADDYVKRAIEKVRKGEIIELSGSLVNVVSKEDGWYWRSSRTRNDTGAGACELIFVESFEVISL